MPDDVDPEPNPEAATDLESEDGPSVSSQALGALVWAVLAVGVTLAAGVLLSDPLGPVLLVATVVAAYFLWRIAVAVERIADAVESETTAESR